jgi:release factor glutamine methyltransferase
MTTVEPRKTAGGATGGESPPSGSHDAWTIQRILSWSTEFLRGKGSPSARLDAELLLAHALGLSRIQLYTGFDKPVLASEREPVRDFLRRRGAGEPVAYITGRKEFMGLAFTVSPAVLIPRPETEVLVETVQAAFKGASPPARILDVGTGSGCIAVALAKHFPSAAVTAWDVSEAALAVAAENARRLEADNIAFERVDAARPDVWDAAPAFDLIVSNPPYIGETERAGLAVSVRDYEPAAALFAGQDGLEFYRHLVRHAATRLGRGGWLGLEIGFAQAAAVVALLTDAGFADVKVARDYDRHDRVVTARRQTAAEGVAP